LAVAAAAEENGVRYHHRLNLSEREDEGKGNVRVHAAGASSLTRVRQAKLDLGQGVAPRVIIAIVRAIPVASRDRSARVVALVFRYRDPRPLVIYQRPAVE
jgi:hypothetical protein